MTIYLDDDCVDRQLIARLIQAGHDVEIPADVGLTGAKDPAHLTHAIDAGRTLLTGNHDDFLALHLLIERARGRHSGIIVVRKDNDPKRDMTRRAMVSAIDKLEKAVTPVDHGFFILNDWR